jgi:nicotinate-nucleotide adenylyltransferase
LTQSPRAARGPVGILGGTFDPVHLGHLRAALEVREACGLAEVRLVPAGAPPHRPAPVAGAALRLRLLRAAVAGVPGLAVDDRETRRAGPSWTVDTLAGLRAEDPARSLCLVLGADAFLGLEDWHRWRELPALAHLVVVHRPGWTLAPGGELGRLLAERRATDPAALRDPAGGAIFVQAITPLAISSSEIRALLARGGDPRFLVPEAVREILVAGGCYDNADGNGRQAGTREG